MFKQRNETFLKFCGPETLIAGYDYWSVLARPRQSTLGAMVLVSNGPQTAFSELPVPAFAELERVVKHLEHAAQTTFSYEKINYLMLMMVDPHVHFHVLPRYSGTQIFAGETIPDSGWPGPPDLSAGPSNERFAMIVRDALKAAWPER